MIAEVHRSVGKPGPSAEAQTTHPLLRIALASCAGTTIEFYDFFIYGTAAALVFGRVFFPSLGAAAATVAAFATFGVAFFFRPLGGVLFGHLGDRLGRKTTLISTLALMGLSTTAIGLLPGPASIGLASPLLLVALRALQGLAVGGEWSGAALLAAEYAPPGRRGRYGMFPQLGPGIAFGLSSTTFLVTTLTMTPAQFAVWGWRIPFVVSVLLVAVGLYIRMRIAETPLFQQMLSRQEQARVPVVDAMRHQWRQIVLVGGAMSTLFGFFYIGSVFLTSYSGPVRGGGLGLSRPAVLACGILAAGVLAGATVASALASDRFGRRPGILAGALVGIVYAPLAFVIMQPGSVVRFGIALVGLMAIVGILAGPAASYLPELFATRYRYTGTGMGYNLAGLLGGALPLVVAPPLAARFGGIGVGMYLAALGLLTVGCLLALPEGRDCPLTTLVGSPVDRHALPSPGMEGAALR
jgi:MFS family permease